MHISSEALDEIDEIKFLIFSYYEDKFLQNYTTRNSLSKNIIEILKNTKLDIFSQNIEKLGKNFNIRFIKDKHKNHIEIRAFGGKDYFLEEKETLDKIKKIVNTYVKSCSPDVDTDLYKKYVEKFIEENKDNLKDIIQIEDIIKKAKYLSKEDNYIEKLSILLQKKEKTRIIDTRTMQL